jgi:hypothetical protein
MFAAVETEAPTPSCLTSHYPGAAAAPGKAPPLQTTRGPSSKAETLQSDNVLHTEQQIRGKGLTIGVIPPHFLPKMHHIGLKVIPGPGIREKK